MIVALKAILRHGRLTRVTDFLCHTATVYSRRTLIPMFYSLIRLSTELAFLLSVLAVQLAIALPTDLGDHNLYTENSTPLGPRAPNFYARILPLGASIVQGRGSSSGNG